MLSKGDIYTNQCNEQRISYTITSVEGDMLTVYSSNLDRSYTLNRVVFEDTMRALGFTLQSDEPTKYKVYFINHQMYHANSYEGINQAIEAGKVAGFEFRIELGEMVCAAWSPISGLRFFSEYQKWRQDQERELARVQDGIH